ncbi:putative Small Conductance Mechanosensitive Ion Channel protein [Halomicronema hongdechloris C2206]|uniref:Small Conductance Mechanosensitive Ion Channel protein n=1 Tax=Halomicronema hongdechloris C2206 TaxID=1641165 RepID=A0A1Z3HKW4_9CYAN|nr:mechanosensitive ion channel family protein [Halomicronema hongdechloris]ASC70962.1 putative Small Conductance Mechanosensitive Ion Channel protein [Halomicronema hongdechloris C2206]
MASLLQPPGLSQLRGPVAQAGDPETLQTLVDDFTAHNLFKALVAIAIAWLLVWGIQHATNWISERVPRRYRLLTKQSLPFLKGLILLTVIAYLVNLFVNLSQQNLLALTGTMAVALGFAFKDYVTSVIAGTVALFEAPYRVGDRVTIGDHYGEVVSYGLRGIRLQTFDDNTVTIPHSKTWTEAISNANSGHLEAQVATDFYFDHHVDMETVLQILYEAAYSSRYTQLKLPVTVVVEEKPWGTHFRLKAYPMDARDEPAYRTDLIRRAKQAFAQEKLPYPHLPVQDQLSQTPHV